METEKRTSEPHPKPTENDNPPHAPKQTDELVALAEEECTLYHDSRSQPYGRWSDGQVCRLDGSGFRRRLHRLYRNRHGSGASPGAVRAAVEELVGAAIYDAPEREVFLRVGQSEPELHIDLGDETWETLQIGPGEVRLGATQLLFERKSHAKALPRPSAGGSLDDLGRFVNAEDEEAFRLMVAWILGTFLPAGPFPVLVLQGEQGSGKSVTAAVLKRLLDPVVPMLRPLPRSERDLAVAAAANRVLAFDNVSFISPWLSDSLCRLATGGGFGTRTHYENEEETVFEQTRPVILTGLDAVARRQDLLDRAIVLRLPRLTSTDRLPEQELWREFDRAHPALLHSLAGIASSALEALPSLETPELPRLADFARWVVAAEQALGWESGTFLSLFTASQATALRTSLEGSPIADTLMTFLRVHTEGEWEGEPTEFHALLTQRAPEGRTRAKTWPANAQALSAQMTRLAPGLREVGIHWESTHIGRGRDKTRWVRVWEAKRGDGGDAGDAGDA